MLARALFCTLVFASTSQVFPAEALVPSEGPWGIPVLLLHFFPASGSNINRQVTGDWGEPLDLTRQKTTRQTRELIAALEEGSRYRPDAHPGAQPSLKYSIAGNFEFLEPLPTLPAKGASAPMTDYRAIMERVKIRDWVEQRGVKEVWVWAYHGGKVNLWESNMASPFGDVSNSDRNPDDLPVLAKTYTVYHYNYQRGTSEATENHVHQIEAVLNHIDGRDRTPSERWPELLFWGRFVGSDGTHKIIRPGCGWAHYPPNGEKDYDWANPRYIETDLDDWRPDGTGRKARLNSDRWGGTGLGWFQCWLQHLPGKGNGLFFNGRRLVNWWVFIGDYDAARKGNLKLAME